MKYERRDKGKERKTGKQIKMKWKSTEQREGKEKKINREKGKRGNRRKYREKKGK